MLAGTLVLSCVAPVALVAAAADERAMVELPSPASVVRQLERLRDEGPAARAAALAELVALGPRAVPAIFALCAGRMPVDRVLDHRRGEPLLDGDGRALLVDALRAWPDDEVGALVLAAAGSDAAPREQRTALVLVGEAGDARSLGVLLRLYATSDPNGLRAPEVQRAVRASVAALLRRLPDAARSLRGDLRATHDALLAPVAEALCRQGGEDELAAAADLLGRDARLDATVLRCLGERDRRQAAIDDGTRAAIARPGLDHVEPDVRRQAAATLGRLHDAEAFERLVELLEDPDRGVRRAAYDALRAVAGTDPGDDPERWWRWWVAERAWLAERVPLLARSARHGPAGEAVRAVGELSSRPLFRRELLPCLADAAGHDDPRVAAAACAGIGRLGAPEALPHLVELLDDPRAAVARAARESLAALTGWTRSADEWRRWMEGT